MSVSIEIHTPGEPVGKISFAERSEFVIGRNPDCACCLKADGLVSRKHAVLLVEPPLIRVKDLKSTNGLTINGVKRGGAAGNPLLEPLSLAVGDEVMVGKTMIRVTAAADVSYNLMLTEADSPRSRDSGVDGPFVLRGGFGGGRERILPAIPGYRLVRAIGTGGMGTVYLAESESTGDATAIKLMNRATSLNKNMVRMFMREIEIAKSIEHPRLVRFYDTGVSGDDCLYLALEYVNGGDMARYIKQSPERRIPPDEALPFMLDVAEGMAYAHEKGLVHRDIKPNNLLISVEEGGKSVKISDLGLAKNFESAGMSGLTNSFTGGGTMAYMSPEQLTDFRDVKPTADVFAMGATFYEMLTGHIPYNFTSDGDNLKVVSSCDIVPIRERRSELSAILCEVIGKCLLAKPEDRYADAGELLAALKAIGL